MKGMTPFPDWLASVPSHRAQRMWPQALLALACG